MDGVAKLRAAIAFSILAALSGCGGEIEPQGAIAHVAVDADTPSAGRVRVHLNAYGESWRARGVSFYGHVGTFGTRSCNVAGGPLRNEHLEIRLDPALALDYSLSADSLRIRIPETGGDLICRLEPGKRTEVIIAFNHQPTRFLAADDEINPVVVVIPTSG